MFSNKLNILIDGINNPCNWVVEYATANHGEIDAPFAGKIGGLDGAFVGSLNEQLCGAQRIWNN